MKDVINGFIQEIMGMNPFLGLTLARCTEKGVRNGGYMKPLLILFSDGRGWLQVDEVPDGLADCIVIGRGADGSLVIDEK